MALKVKVNASHFQNQLKESQDAYLVHVQYQLRVSQNVCLVQILVILAQIYDELSHGQAKFPRILR